MESIPNGIYSGQSSSALPVLGSAKLKMPLTETMSYNELVLIICIILVAFYGQEALTEKH